jgi:hypothetical protein
MEDDPADTLRSEAELRKLRLEIEKLSIDVASAARFARLDLILRLLPTLTVLEQYSVLPSRSGNIGLNNIRIE